MYLQSPSGEQHLAPAPQFPLMSPTITLRLQICSVDQHIISFVECLVHTIIQFHCNHMPQELNSVLGDRHETVNSELSVLEIDKKQ